MHPLVSQLNHQFKYVIRFVRDSWLSGHILKASKSKYTIEIMGIECTLPPLRTLDDFALSSARFEMPNIQDLDKWGNRVAKNLLYYQTNYFALGAVLIALFAFSNPSQTLLGVIAFAMIIGAFVYINPSGVQGQPQREGFAGSTGWLYIGGLFAGFYLVLYLFSAIAYVGLIFLLPFSIAFIHASFRCRNLKNKLTNAIDDKLRYTPMGIFLEAMSITVDSTSK